MQQLKKYYISYIADASLPMEVFRIVEATSCGNAYKRLCNTQGAHFHGETPQSDEDAITRLRESQTCSVNICFLLPEELQERKNDDLRILFRSMPEESFGNYFELSTEKIVRTGASQHYKALEPLLRKAEQQPWHIVRSRMTRRFERMFLPNSWFKKER